MKAIRQCALEGLEYICIQHPMWLMIIELLYGLNIHYSMVTCVSVVAQAVRVCRIDIILATIIQGFYSYLHRGIPES